jgi:UDP-N-acetylmuramyl pentapeptide synthase
LPDTIEKYYFENKEPVADFLLNKLLQNNDIVLIKGARYSSKLYQVTEELLKKGKQE